MGMKSSIENLNQFYNKIQKVQKRIQFLAVVSLNVCGNMKFAWVFCVVQTQNDQNTPL